MGEHQVTTYYCDVSTLRTYEVKILPDDRQDPQEGGRKRLIRVHDAELDPRTWYGVPPQSLGNTELQAIIAARDELKDADREIAEQMQKLQGQRDKIASLLSLSDPTSSLKGKPVSTEQPEQTMDDIYQDLLFELLEFIDPCLFDEPLDSASMVKFAKEACLRRRVAEVNALVDAHGNWGKHPLFSPADWSHEVANGDTRLGYWEWCADREESADFGSRAEPDDKGLACPDNEPL